MCGKDHPTELELAALSDAEEGAVPRAHALRCSRCRNSVAEYRWLHDQIGSALKTAAVAVPLKRPRWRAVRRRVRAERFRRVVEWRASVAGSGVLALFLMLSLSPVLGVAVAQTVFPIRATLPEPSSPAAQESVTTSPATPTPASSLEIGSEEGAATPILIPLPTPAVEPGT
jgi:hypothetical protein